jgi:hypothetical protein
MLTNGHYVLVHNNCPTTYKGTPPLPHLLDGSHLQHTATMCLYIFIGSMFCVQSNRMRERNSSFVHSFSRSSVFQRKLCRRCIFRNGEDVIRFDMGLLPYCTTCTSVPITQCSCRYMRSCVAAPVLARKILNVSLIYCVIRQQHLCGCGAARSLHLPALRNETTTNTVVLQDGEQCLFIQRKQVNVKQ